VETSSFMSTSNTILYLSLNNMYLLIPIAFLSGILTVFSPCVLPILPIILSSGIDGDTNRIKGVIVGLVMSFTAASLLLATAVRFFGVPADSIRDSAVLLLILLGISMIFPTLGDKVQTVIEHFWKVRPTHKKSGGFNGGIVTGISLGVVWTPCIGPVLATVATLAAINSISLITALIAFSFALGTGLPLYYIAKGGRSITSKLSIFKQKNQQIRQLFGVIIIITVLFIWTGADRGLQAWTLSHLPESWTQVGLLFQDNEYVKKSLLQIKNTK